MRNSFGLFVLGLALLINGCGGGGGGSGSSSATTPTTTTTYTYTVSTIVGSFNKPDSLVSDKNGNIYVLDTTNKAIKIIDSNGNVNIFFSGLSSGSSGIAIDSGGNLYVSSSGLISKINSSGTSILTFAGSTPGYSDGIGTFAQFRTIWGMIVDASDNLYVADTGNNNIRKITPTGSVTTFAGSTNNTPGSNNGNGTSATFNQPASLAFDSNGNLFVSEFGNHTIRKITSTGAVSTFAGSTVSGSADGTSTSASFDSPLGIVIDSLDNIYVADQQNNKIRKITSSGVVTTIIGSNSGSTDGVGTAALLNLPNGITKDSSGNLYISDYGNNLIRKVTITSVTTTN